MMAKLFEIKENDINFVLEVEEDGSVVFLHCQQREFRREDVKESQKDWYRLVELQVAGEDQDDHHGSKYTGTLPARRLKYKDLLDKRNTLGRKVEIKQEDEKTGLEVISHIQFFDRINTIESWTSVNNKGIEAQTLTYVSSFALTGLTKSALQSWDEITELMIPSNTWCGEFQWNTYKVRELGLSKVTHYSTKRLDYSATGTWNSHEYLPMGFVSNEETKEGWYFSIIHNGSWHWEVSDIKDEIYLQISGPTEAENHWYQTLEPGETFTSVPVAISLTVTGFSDATKEMTKYRRKKRRLNADNEELPVIFNDFMNCLSGNPTEEKEYPLIDAAAKAGCEYYTIDAGWYANGSWWSRVGEWEYSKERFPNGLAKVMDYIRNKGMIPGLWLELEVIGINCPIADELPDEWFFLRHNKRVIDHGRYQLDYRNPEVCKFADDVVARLVEKYGAGYIKMDYNINAGCGTEFAADSPGAGLLEHNRAYLNWLDQIFTKYPDLIIENCASGGMRINDALLSRHSIQSSSDQTNYLRYSAIAAAAPAALTVEQAAVWSYPLADDTAEAVVFNMINAMLMRIHQSGQLNQIIGNNFALIQEGIACYKTYRGQLKKAYPFWPLGLPKSVDQWICLGLYTDKNVYLAIWNTQEEAVQEIDLTGSSIEDMQILYPQQLFCEYNYYPDSELLTVHLPAKSARLFKGRIKNEKKNGDVN